MCIGAVTSTIIKPLKLKLKKSHKSANTYIISKNGAADIEAILLQEGFNDKIFHIADTTNIPDDNHPKNIIIDDREFSYQEIINLIMKNSEAKRFYHIYSGRNNIIISPKRQR